MGSAFAANIGVATQLFHIRDEKALLTDGGTFTSGSWQTRDLNTVMLNEIPGASVTSNQLSLPAGIYHVEATAPAFFVSNHQARLQDITNSTTIRLGGSQWCREVDSASNSSDVQGTFVLTEQTTIELQHQCFVTRASNGFGVTGRAATEVYADIRLWREIPAVNDGNGTLVNGPLLHVCDEKANNVDGGTFTQDVWQTRDLNTIKSNEIVGASVSGNKITLPPGSYYIEANAPAWNAQLHKAKLWSVTAGADLIIGTAEFSPTTAATISQTDSTVEGKFTLGVTAELEIRHRCSVTSATFGFGVGSSFSVNELYTEVKIWQLVRAGSSDTNVITAGLLGEVRSTIIAAAPPGWIMLTGDSRVSTLGNPSSGADRANADTEDLFIAYWNEMADAQAPVSTGRGGGAAADYAANKTLTMPDPRGRSIIGTGTGASLTARIHGGTGGGETHQLIVSEMPSHSHGISDNFSAVSGGSNRARADRDNAKQSLNTGGNGAHANMQPWLAFNVIQKL